STACRVLPTAPAHADLYPLSYTTLFRSGGDGVVIGHRHQPVGDLAVEHFGHEVGGPALDLVRREVRALQQGRDRRLGGHDLDLRDRKSTRLNSSHVKISYAVFCLKKKKV